MANVFGDLQGTSLNYRNPTLIGIAASAALTILVIVGSRNL